NLLKVNKMEYVDNSPGNSEVPDWENIKYITEDLKDVLDNFQDDSTPIPAMKVRLARAIAQMRDEKGMEEQRRLMTIQNPYKAIQEMTRDLQDKLRKSMRKYNPD
ncbi:MAG: hypothetical protein ACFFCS_24035, partial [Candidatus Hodarchaeota archaeon]